MLPFCVSAGLVLVLDLISKHLISSGMELNSSVTLIPGVLDFTFIVNKGAAWGILAESQWLLQVLTAAVMIALVIYVCKKHRTMIVLEIISLGMIVGGGLGNFISRVFSGEVVDFINLVFLKFFNIFNVADIGITVGCVLLVISVFFIKKDNNAG